MKKSLKEGKMSAPMLTKKASISGDEIDFEVTDSRSVRTLSEKTLLT